MGADKPTADTTTDARAGAAASTETGAGSATALVTEPASTGAEMLFPPTVREVMLRPRWLGMLAFALAVAALFAWLGQWQLARAIDTNPPPPGITEQVKPIAEVVAPGAYLPGPYGGQRVEVAGAFVPGDFIVVSSRFNGGEEGYWVTGQLRVAPGSVSGSGDGATASAPTSLAVAIGWTADRAVADAAATALAADAEIDLTLTGRLISDEGAVRPPRGAAPTEMTTMSPAALLGRWHDIDGLDVYRPFLVADGGESLPDGLVAIDSPAPVVGSNVNWLNVFYAVEWVIFAGFAFYMWYRLARDAQEREVEAMEEAAASQSAGPVVGSA